MKEISGLTAEEIAKKTNVPLGTLNKILGGYTPNPLLETMRRIVVDGLGFTLDDLYDGEKPESELDEYMEALRYRPELAMLFRVSKNATKEEIEKVTEMIETFKKESEPEE